MRWLILILLLCSCGARKSEMHKTETESKSETAITQQNDIVTEVKTETEIQAETLNWIISPIDNSLPSSVTTPEGKTYKLENAKLEFKKQKQETKENTQAKTSDKSTANVKHSEEAKTVTKDKITDRKESYAMVIWGVIILLIILIIWFIYSKIKKRATIL